MSATAWRVIGGLVVAAAVWAFFYFGTEIDDFLRPYVNETWYNTLMIVGGYLIGQAIAHRLTERRNRLRDQVHSLPPSRRLP
jgi:hypothetical protein